MAFHIRNAKKTKGLILMINTFAQTKPDLERDEDLQLLQENMLERFESVAQQLNSHRDQFLKHSAIWRDSKQAYLNKFLNAGSDENYEPPLSQFKMQVKNIF